MEKLNKTSSGYGIAAAVAIIANTLLVFAKETNTDLLAWMKAATSHHWITHGLIVIGLFVVCGWLLARVGPRIGGYTLAVLLFVSTALAGLGLVGWFWYI